MLLGIFFYFVAYSRDKDLWLDILYVGWREVLQNFYVFSWITELYTTNLFLHGPYFWPSNAPSPHPVTLALNWIRKLLKIVFESFHKILHCILHSKYTKCKNNVEIKRFFLINTQEEILQPFMFYVVCLHCKKGTVKPFAGSIAVLFASTAEKVHCYLPPPPQI